MPKYSAKYIAPGDPTPDGWVKYGNIAVDVNGTANANDQPFTSGISESLAASGYAIITDTSNAGIVGRAIAGGPATASENTTTFWVSVAKTEESFCDLFNRLPARQDLISITGGTAATQWLNDNGYWTSYSVYYIANGTKSPALGSGNQSPFPASGWTTLISSSGDDASIQVSLPFSWTFNGTSYSEFYPNSNFYITFGSGTSQYSGLAANSPNLNKIFFGGKDNSWQRVSSFASEDKYFRLRWEGTNSTGGTPGSSTVIYELTFFNPIYTNGENWLELIIGNNNMPGQGISGIYSDTAQLSGGQIVPSNVGVAALESYVLQGNSTGTSWTVHTGKFVGGTDY